MKFHFKLFLLLSITLNIVSVSAAEIISKKQKEACNIIKKSLNAKKVEVFENSPESPYYKVTTKGGKKGVADKNGRFILPADYNEIVYFPEHTSDKVDISVVNDKDKVIGTTSFVTMPSREIFWGFSEDKGANLYDVRGNKINSFPHKSADYFGNYIYLKDDPYMSVLHRDASTNNIDNVPCIHLWSYYSDKGHGHGMLLRADGSEVIPVIDRGDIYEDNPFIIYSINAQKDVELFGMKSVDNKVYTQNPVHQNKLYFKKSWVNVDAEKFISEIPPEFYDVQALNGVWKISDSPANGSATKPFNPLTSRARVIRDPGEIFYLNHKDDDVLVYYSTEGLDAPWASFYSAKALDNKAYYPAYRFKNVVKSMENGGGLPKNEQGVISDIGLIENMLQTAIRLYNQYVASGEEEFHQEALSNIESDKYQLKFLEDLKVRYNKVRSHAAQVTSQQEAQQAAYMQMILGSFTSALNAISNRTSSKSSKSSGTTFSNTGGSVSSSSSGSNSVDNSDRKAFLRNQITDWKNKLKKAEKSYEQAMGSGDDSWQKKMVLESKQHTIDECANMIRQYEAELNSLK